MNGLEKLKNLKSVLDKGEFATPSIKYYDKNGNVICTLINYYLS